MRRELERRLLKVEAKHHAERNLDKRIERMTDAELTAAIRACNAQLEAEYGPTWRDWLAENDPDAHRALSQLERKGVELLATKRKGALRRRDEVAAKEERIRYCPSAGVRICILRNYKIISFELE